MIDEDDRIDNADYAEILPDKRAVEKKRAFIRHDKNTGDRSPLFSPPSRPTLNYNGQIRRHNKIAAVRDKETFEPVAFGSKRGSWDRPKVHQVVPFKVASRPARPEHTPAVYEAQLGLDDVGVAGNLVSIVEAYLRPRPPPPSPRRRVIARWYLGPTKRDRRILRHQLIGLTPRQRWQLWMSCGGLSP